MENHLGERGMAKMVKQHVIKKSGSNIFIVDKFCIKKYNIWGFQIMKHVYM